MAFLAKLVDKLQDAHMAVGLFVFVVVSTYHFVTGKDLGANYVNAIYATYAFLAGHGVAALKWGNGNGKDSGSPPTS